MLSLSFPYFFFRVSDMDWGIPEFCWGAVAACGRVGSSILGGGWVDYLVVNGRNYKGELWLYLIQFPSYSTKKDRGAQELGIELPTWTVDVILFSFMLGTGNFSANSSGRNGPGMGWWFFQQVADALEIFPRAGELSRLFGLLAKKMWSFTWHQRTSGDIRGLEIPSIESWVPSCIQLHWGMDILSGFTRPAAWGGW